jgi:hypothetical protein
MKSITILLTLLLAAACTNLRGQTNTIKPAIGNTHAEVEAMLGQPSVGYPGADGTYYYPDGHKYVFHDDKITNISFVGIHTSKPHKTHEKWAVGRVNARSWAMFRKLTGRESSNKISGSPGRQNEPVSRDFALK